MSRGSVDIRVILVVVIVLSAGLLLFSGGSPPATVDSLEEAAKEGNLDDTRFLLRNGVDPNERLRFGHTPMHSAAWRGHTDLVRLMLDHGGDPNRRHARSGATPLIAATRGNRAGTVAALVQAGADPEIPITDSSVQCASGVRYSAGSTAMDIARQSGFDRVLHALKHR